jgi:hypothetical protein
LQEGDAPSTHKRKRAEGDTGEEEAGDDEEDEDE